MPNAPRKDSRRSRRQIAEWYPYSSRREFDLLKRAADKEVQRARAQGVLVQQACEVCGREKSEAHHDDYSKPLDVKWLCRFHHRRRDAELREAWNAELRQAEQNGLPQSYLRRLAEKNKPPVQIPDAVRAALEARYAPKHLTANPRALDLVCQATSVIADVMDVERVSENHLAQRIGSSRQHVNNAFAGGVRTLKLLAAMADALGYDASVVLRKRPAAAESGAA